MRNENIILGTAGFHPKLVHCVNKFLLVKKAYAAVVKEMKASSTIMQKHLSKHLKSHLEQDLFLLVNTQEGFIFYFIFY